MYSWHFANEDRVPSSAMESKKNTAETIRIAGGAERMWTHVTPP